VSSHALQQQHDGVELLPGSVVGSERHNEVVQAVSGTLRGHNDQFVIEAVGAGVLKHGVVTSLGEMTVVMEDDGSVNNGEVKISRHVNPYFVHTQAAERHLFLKQVAERRRAADIRRVQRVSLHPPVAQAHSYL